LTGKVEGERRGRRFYAKSELVYDADLNAARNIGNRSKLPVSLGGNALLDGQGIVNCPNNVCKSSFPQGKSVLQAPE
jgi:transposase